MLQEYDPRNDTVQIFIKDKLYPREHAKISVFPFVVCPIQQPESFPSPCFSNPKNHWTSNE